jgi:hypothetical protein
MASPASRSLAAILLALMAVSCNRGPAEEALQAAEQALTAAPEVETYAPEDFEAVSQTLREARASYDAGRYTDALRAAQVLPDRIAAAAVAAGKRKQQSAASWGAHSVELEPKLEALAARLTLLASEALISSERLAAAQGELATLNQGWAEARAAHDRGEVPKAVAAAGDIKGRADALGARLGLRMPPVAPPSTPRRAAVP